MTLARLDIAADRDRPLVDRRAAALALLGRDHRRRFHRPASTRSRRCLPDGMQPAPDGAASVVFADWSSASDNDERVLADPGDRPVPRGVRGAARACAATRRSGRVPFIWVDSELSMLRGQIQGFPKKLGQIAMTKPVDARPRRRAQARRRARSRRTPRATAGACSRARVAHRGARPIACRAR